MKTLAQSWGDRLAELRAICRENGERLSAGLQAGFERDHRDAWWREFCHAAESGEKLAPSVWRSAHKEGEARRMSEWVCRLQIRNRNKRSSPPPILPKGSV